MSDHPTLHRPGECGCDCEWGGGPETCTVKVWVRGCFGKPLGGATVVSSAHGGTFSPATDEPITWALNPGVPMTVTISHERFETVVLDFECPGGGVLEALANMTPKAGYACDCLPILAGGLDQPVLPWKLPLRVTDSQGTAAISPPTGLSGGVCVARTAPNVGDSCDPVIIECYEAEGGVYEERAVPPPIGEGIIDVWYDVGVCGDAASVIIRTLRGGLAEYNPDDEDGTCGVPNSRIAWYCPADGCATARNTSWTLATVTVNSRSPLNLTFSRVSGPGESWGPEPYGWPPIVPLGTPFASSVVVSESP